MPDITNKRVAVLATNGFEQSELEVPVEKLREAGATVHVVAPEGNEITGWQGKDWGNPVTVDRQLSDISADDYDALVLPGGQINPDLLRVEPAAIQLIKDFNAQKKVIGAICHAPWLLIEAGIAAGREMTSYPSIRTDLKNAGAIVHDEEVVVDEGIVTSRNPDDLPAFCSKLIEEIAEGRHEKRAA